MMHEYFGGIELHAFGPADVIFTEFKFSVVGGIVFGLPVLLQQLWLFVVPAIHPRTRRMVYAFILPSLAAGRTRPRVRALRRDPAGRRRVAAHHRRGRDADVRYRRDAQFRDRPARALRRHLPNADRARSAWRVWASSAQASLMHYRRHAIFGFFVAGGIAAPDGNPLDDGVAGAADVRALRDLDLDHSAAATALVVRIGRFAPSLGMTKR